MDQIEIKQRFDTVIAAEMKAAGARFDDNATAEVANFTRNAAFAIVTATSDDEEQEGAVGQGAAAYKTLVADMVAFAKRIRQFPVLGEHAVKDAVQKRGPNPPYYF